MIQSAFKHAVSIACAAVAGLGGGTGWAQDTPSTQAAPPLPFVIEKIDTTCEDGPIRGWFAAVDLTDPRLDVLVTAPLPADESRPAEVESVLTATDAWARGHHAVLAINANFFRWIKDEQGQANGTSDIMGLSISDGQTVSAARTWQGHGDPVLVFDKDGLAQALELKADSDTSAYEDAVAGIGPSQGDPDHGGLLIDDGMDRGPHARVAPTVRHPRTAVGVNQDGTRLLLLVIDGRQPEWSVGATLPDMSRMLLERGAFDAVALDGGGSSSFYFDVDPDDQIAPVVNRPSDGHFRAVANHLGFSLTQAAASGRSEPNEIMMSSSIRNATSTASGAYQERSAIRASSPSGKD